MNWLLQITLAAVSSFVATNIDDIFILMFLLSQAKVNSSIKVRHIVIGQYLGFLLIILLSLPGFIGGLVISKAWIGLLGFLPIFFNQLKQEPETESHEAIAVSPMKELKGLLHPVTYSVAAITFANGGDNIGIYVPFFASLNWPGLVVVLTIFLILVGVWCALAYWLTLHTLIAKILIQRGKQIVPFVLIGLGCFILWENRSYTLIFLR